MLSELSELSEHCRSTVGALSEVTVGPVGAFLTGTTCGHCHALSELSELSELSACRPVGAVRAVGLSGATGEKSVASAGEERQASADPAMWPRLRLVGWRATIRRMCASYARRLLELRLEQLQLCMGRVCAEPELHIGRYRAITGLLKYHILSSLTAFQHCVTPGKFEVSVFD